MDILREVRSYQAPTFNDSASTLDEQTTLSKLKISTPSPNANLNHSPATDIHAASNTQQQDSGFISQFSQFALRFLSKKHNSRGGTDEMQKRTARQLRNKVSIIEELAPPVEEEMAYIYPVFEQ